MSDRVKLLWIDKRAVTLASALEDNAHDPETCAGIQRVWDTSGHAWIGQCEVKCDPIDRFDLAQAAHWYGSDNHGGQWCPLYRLTGLGYHAGPMESGPDDTEAATILGGMSRDDVVASVDAIIEAIEGGSDAE